MRGNKLLKNLGIKIVEQLSKEQHIVVADNVATMISNRFNYIDYGYLYSKLMAAKMYTAKMPEGVTDAIYLYEDDALIINYVENLTTVSESLLYQCIHALQDVRTKKGVVKQLGQCTFSEFKTYAIALNEASIQYMVSKILKYDEETVDAYGIRAKTFGTNKYPLICNILKQLLFISNEDVLVKSTMYSLDEFIIEVIEEIGESAFTDVRKNLDDLLYASEEIIDIKRKIKQKEDDSQQIEDALNRMNNIEQLIKKTYMNTQGLIFTSYFDNLYKRVENEEDIKIYLNRIEEYKQLMGMEIEDQGNYINKFYDDYLKDKKERLELKEDAIKARKELALAVVTKNKLVKFFYFLRAKILREF